MSNQRRSGAVALFAMGAICAAACNGSIGGSDEVAGGDLSPGEELLVARGSVWRYLDNGSDQGSGWRAPGFDDSGWRAGPAELGYGDGDEATVVSYGPRSSRKYITTYFRRAFDVGDPAAYAGLEVRVRRDDGAVVYLNGVEIFRTSMPAGTITYTTLATTQTSETTFFVSSVPVGLLVPGRNVLAVEIHQVQRTSSDISFDLELVARSPDAGTPSTDGGPAPIDAGTPAPDGGPLPADSGPAPTDSGPPPTGCPASACFYASPTGSDTDPGTLTQPFRTIARGLRALHPGELLYLRGGVWSETFNYDHNSSPASYPAGTSWTSPVTIAGYPGETALLRPELGPARIFTFTGSTTAYVVLKDLVLDAYNASVDAIKITLSSSTGPAHHIRIQDCEIMNAHSMGILITGQANDCQLVRLDIHDSGNTSNPALPPLTMTPAHYHAIYVGGAQRTLIEGCHLHHNPGCGVHVYAGDATNGGTVVRFNRTHDQGVWAQYGCGIIIGSGNDNVAYDNISWNNGAYGVQIGYQGSLPAPADNNRALHNTIYHNGKYGIEISGGVQNSIVRNNISFANNWANTDDNGLATVWDHNVTVDPSFVDPAAGDFHVRSGSPAIDTGVTVAEVPADFDGVTRPQGAAYDVGAYER